MDLHSHQHHLTMPINLSKSLKDHANKEAKRIRERMRIHSRQYQLHSAQAHKFREEILRQVPEQDREGLRQLLGQFTDYVRFTDAAQRKLYELNLELQTYDDVDVAGHETNENLEQS